MSYDQAMNNFNKQNYNRLAPILKKKTEKYTHFILAILYSVAAFKH